MEALCPLAAVPSLSPSALFPVVLLSSKGRITRAKKKTQKTKEELETNRQHWHSLFQFDTKALPVTLFSSSNLKFKALFFTMYSFITKVYELFPTSGQKPT